MRRDFAPWLLVATLLGPATAHAATRDASVLILLPGQPGLPAATSIATGVRAPLVGEWSLTVSIETEHVDIARFASAEVEERRLRTLYGSKYGRQHFDVIVATGGEVLQFLLRARDDLWPRTPVVVCGADERLVRDVPARPGFTIVTIRYDMEGTLRAALAVLPDTRRVALVGGAGPQEQAFHDLARQAVATVGRLELVDLTKLPVAEMLARVSALPEHTIILLSSYQVDGAGRRFYGLDIVGPLTAGANRPVFTPFGIVLGRGVVGGSLIDFEAIGREAGAFADLVLHGEALPPSPVASAVRSTLLFDGRQLARWGLDERRLPAGSDVLYRQPTLWQQYRWHVLAAVGLIGAESALIVTLLVQRRRRREAQERLAERVHFELLMSEIVTACATVTTERLDEQMRDCLRRVVMFLDVDRGALWQPSSDGALLSVTHLWQQDGIAPPPTTIDLRPFAYFLSCVQAGQGGMAFRRPDDLPPEAAAEREAFKRQGVRSFAAIPLHAAHGWLGVLALVSVRAERAWPEDLVRQLQALAEHFSHALVRSQSAVELASSTALTGAVLAALPGETAIIDAEGTISQTNEAWATTAKGEPRMRHALAVGANYLQACREAIDMPPDVASKVEASIRSILAGERDEFALEYPSVRRGESRWLEIRVRRLARLGGGAAVMLFDVTARRRAEAAAQQHVGQLAHLDRVAAMGQLASSLAHELNQPLAAILTTAQAAIRLLALPQPDLDEIRACLADIASDDQRAAEVIRHMRRLLKKSDFVKLPVNLNDLVANTIGLVANDALLHGVTIQFVPAPALPVIYGDLVQIQQVILNLLSNAITAAAGESTRKVTVWTAAVAAPYVELGVRDTGKGIADDDIDRLFQPFFTTKSEGLGMGLAISRTIVEAHGGRLEAENDRAGGATFRVHLRTDPSDTAS